MYTCEQCGHTPEETVQMLILRAGMQMESDGSLEQQLADDLRAISPDLENEFVMEGTAHPLAKQTISEIRAIAEAGELPTGGSALRLAASGAAMAEWNQRVLNGELSLKTIRRFQHTSSLEAMEELGWENPYS
ncbi:hypothetical protein LCGC14_1886010 [marine sediment metagenome]|uniref:Uncharacterized protein n=1 Tax=marine sediment metagenome TaxID=412755 RepID=A0A0F9G0X6_9ZZZZ